jgi:NOL1/NOP2/fmu family ribosome biogenesis protein
MNILSRKETEEIEERIRNTYGTEDCLKEFVVLQTGKEEKIWLASRKIFELNLEVLRINSIGLYFGRVDCGKLRLSVEGAGIVGPKAKKNIAEIDDTAIWDFLRGFDVKPSKLNEAEEGRYVLVKHKDHFIGVAKLENGMLISVLPKSRKLISLTK